jgi:hypothetical protein
MRSTTGPWGPADETLVAERTAQSEQIVHTMQLLQVTTLDELEPKHVTRLTRLAERRPRDLY